MSVLLLTKLDSSRSREYMFGVHGSKMLGNRKERSPVAIMRLARMTGSGLFSNMVNKSCKCSSQNSELTSIIFAKVRLADVRSCGLSLYLYNEKERNERKLKIVAKIIQASKR